MFTQGNVYLHVPTEKYYMSLGFRKWGTLGIEFSRITYRDMEFLTMDEAAEGDPPFWMFNFRVQPED